MNEKNIIVTAYYIVENKRPSVDFNDWIENFFYLKSRKIIFTNKETMDSLFLKKFKHIFNDTLFIIQELEDTYIWKNYKNLMEFS